MNNYDDIIDMPAFHAPDKGYMSLHDRAAQFAPFKALTGYEDAIDETARLTDERPVLSEEERNALDETINLLRADPSGTEIEIEYFVPDERKDGGAILTLRGFIRRIDEVNSLVFFTDGFSVSFRDICSIRLNPSADEAQ